jgi:hypothetical protein
MWHCPHVHFGHERHALGFLAWEIPRMQRRPHAAHGQHWQSALGGLAATEYPTLHELAEELPDAVSESQFEAGLNALLRGFTGREPQK